MQPDPPADSAPLAPAAPVAVSGDAPFLYFAWLVALVGTFSSLFFGEVMQLPPCTLCWYQRICLFPLSLVLTVGILLKDARVVHYALPLVVLGFGIAVYHNGVYWGVIPESLSPCAEGVSCREVHLEWLGFITIPFLSFSAFSLIGASLWLHQRTTGSTEA
ncbi:MAG: disulfide bond formation protein B [Myxococcota bacterium]